MKSARWASTAIDDLNDLRNYFAEDNLVAQRIIERLVLATDWLLDWPFAGQQIAQSGWRNMVAPTNRICLDLSTDRGRDRDRLCPSGTRELAV